MIITPTFDELYDFLTEVDKDFPTPLSDKVDLSEYTKKLIDFATISVTKEKGEIVSLVAGYTRLPVNNRVFIPVVATKKAARGKGYAKAEILEIISETSGVEAFHLYTSITNASALNLYYSIGFEAIKRDNEPRPNDVHLVYYVRGENNAD